MNWWGSKARTTIWSDQSSWDLNRYRNHRARQVETTLGSWRGANMASPHLPTSPTLSHWTDQTVCWGPIILQKQVDDQNDHRCCGHDTSVSFMESWYLRSQCLEKWQWHDSSRLTLLASKSVHWSSGPSKPLHVHVRHYTMPKKLIGHYFGLVWPYPS